MTGSLPRRAIGSTGLKVSVLGFGTMAVGGQYADVSDADAAVTIAAARAAGITFFDTAPQYGCGLAEERLGAALRNQPSPLFVVSSKVAKRIVPLGSGGQAQCALHFPGGHDAEMLFDFSYDGTLRMVDDTLRRLGRSTLEMLLIHDVTRHFHGDDGIDDALRMAMDGTLRALHDLRDQGVVRAIGIGLKDIDVAMRFVEEGDIDVALVPGRMTLLDQSALTSGLLDTCAKHGVAYIAAAPFDSGILATGAVAGARSAYKLAESETLARVATMARVCTDHGVSLQAVALQYALQHPAVVSVLAGMKTPAEVAANVAAIESSVPSELWAALGDVAGVAVI
jgi:D-threo-aldose 1-dehydrogenase